MNHKRIDKNNAKICTKISKPLAEVKNTQNVQGKQCNSQQNSLKK